MNEARLPELMALRGHAAWQGQPGNSGCWSPSHVEPGILGRRMQWQSIAFATGLHCSVRKFRPIAMGLDGRRELRHECTDTVSQH